MTSKIVSSRIHDIFEKRQMFGEQRRVFIAQALDCSMATARRRDLTGGWTIDEVALLSSKLGISAEKILQTNDSPDSIRALATISGALVTVLIEIGEVLSKNNQSKLCARDDDGKWMVDFSANFPPESILYTLKKLTYLSISVAVVDDSLETLHATTAALNALGLDAVGHESKQDFLTSIESNEYHAFIIDWKLGDEQADDLLNSLRKKYPTAPIIVLTGEAGTSSINHSLLVETLRTLGLQFHQKPAIPSQIASQIFHMMNI